jgi:hypothetical protein
MGAIGFKTGQTKSSPNRRVPKIPIKRMQMGAIGYKTSRQKVH